MFRDLGIRDYELLQGFGLPSFVSQCYCGFVGTWAPTSLVLLKPHVVVNRQWTKAPTEQVAGPMMARPAGASAAAIMWQVVPFLAWSISSFTGRVDEKQDGARLTSKQSAAVLTDLPVCRMIG